MLEHAGRIAHPLDGGEIGDQRPEGSTLAGDPARPGGDHGGNFGHPDLGEARPDHRATAFIGAPGQAGAIAVAAEQMVDLAREGRAVAEIHQHAMAIGQDLGRMNIGGGDHRLADADRIGQRARSDLRRIDIGRGVDIGCLEIGDQFVMFEKRIDELDMVGDAALLGQCLEPLTIGFALWVAPSTA